MATLALYPPSATAQADGAASARAAQRQVTAACRAETARFCPTLDEENPIAQSQVICLRPYAASLSLGCRRAVRAASQQPG